MSHIITNNEDLIAFSDYIKRIKKRGLSNHIIEEIILYMLEVTNMQCLVSYLVIDSNMKCVDERVCYCSNLKIIFTYINSLNRHIEEGYNFLSKHYNINDSSELKAYLFLIILAHEVEHAYQNLMGENMEPAPTPFISKAYKELFDLFKNENKNRLIIDKYYKRSNELLIERNAQIDSYSFAMQCAKYANQETLYKAFEDMLVSWSVLGYQNNNKGSIFETYNYLGLKDVYDTFCCDVDMAEKEKIRYGLPIEEETRQTLFGYGLPVEEETGKRLFRGR